MTSTSETGDLVSSAVTAGVISAREAASGAVGVCGSALVLHGRPIAYARRRAADPGSAADRELACLRALAGTGVVPEVLHADRTIWTAAVRGLRLAEVTGSMADLAEACQSWGTAIAALHRTPVGAGAAAAVAPRPWLLDPDRLPRGMRQAPVGSARAFVVNTLRGDRGLRRTSLRLADRWTAEHWTHADLTADRVLVRHAPDLRVCLVDLRGGGLGDPGWDLAGALETIGELTGGPRAPWAAASAGCLRDYLVHGYRRAGGLAVLEPGTRALRVLARAWDLAVALDVHAANRTAPAVTATYVTALHPSAGHAREVSWLVERLTLARELAAQSSRPGLLAA